MRKAIFQILKKNPNSNNILIYHNLRYPELRAKSSHRKSRSKVGAQAI